jgi:hypothetical protein
MWQMIRHWQAGQVLACQQIANRPPLNFHIQKTPWTTGFNANLTGTGLTWVSFNIG